MPAEGHGDLPTLICVLVARPKRCPTLSNPVPWQNWMASYLGYTLRMKTLFLGWLIMVNDTHTRRRRIESRIRSTERRHFQWPWTTPTSSFKGSPFFDAEYLTNGTTHRHSFSEILRATYTRSTQQLFWLTLSDVEWLSKIWFNDTKRRAVSLWQLSFLSRLASDDLLHRQK